MEMAHHTNKSWTTLTNRFCQEYRTGVKEFMLLARGFANSDGKVRCPCCKCVNRFRQTPERLENHLYTHGFKPSYKVWIYHGEDHPPLDPVLNEVEIEEDIVSVFSDIEGARMLDGLRRSSCEEPGDTSPLRPSKKSKRGPSRGTNVDKHVNKYGKITLQFDDETGQPYGNWASGFNNAICRIVRSRISPRTTQWSDVDASTKTRIVNELLEKFNFNHKSVAIREHIEIHSMNTLRDWRCRLRGCFYAVKGDTNLEEAKKHVPKDCDKEDWKWLCDYFGSPEQLAISARNKANRSKKLYSSKQGSKSNVAHRYEMADQETNELPSMVTMFRKMHWSEKTGWSNDLAKAHYEEMIEQIAQGDYTTGESSGGDDPSGADRIYHDVVGKRSRYKKGVGALPRLKALDGQIRAAPGTYSGGPSSSQLASTEIMGELQRLTQRLDHQNTLISLLYDAISRIGPAVGVLVPPIPTLVEPTPVPVGTSGAGRTGPSSSRVRTRSQRQTLLGSSSRQVASASGSHDPYLS